MGLISEVTGYPETCGIGHGNDGRCSFTSPVLPRESLVYRFAIQKGAELQVRVIGRDIQQQEISTAFEVLDDSLVVEPIPVFES